ncbi:unnamed protein product [Cylicocyclus nassatus]|uniref:Uncharacterized protein n=1 Tax=Cylicocyclus nassatus TaxID=53992 RepID=A0AA36DN42_CYLNA|nr:unnamed protein product [Cylicocyclus nassatus]
MKYSLIVIIFAIVFRERHVASLPYAYPAFSTNMLAVPYVHPVAPIMHAVPAYHPHIAYRPYHELQNVAGAVKKELNLLTDVAVRFPIRRS